MFHIVSFEYWDHYSYTVLQKNETLVGQQTTHGESLGGPFFSGWSVTFIVCAKSFKPKRAWID